MCDQLVVERLGISEWDKLKPIFQEQFKIDPPTPTSAVVIVAKERTTGRVVAVLSVVSLVHAEPMWIDPEYRGRGVVKALINKARKVLPEIESCLVHTTSDRVANLFSRLGMVRQDWRVFKWVAH